MTVTHRRRPLSNRAECDPDDARLFAEDPDRATCQACHDAHARRTAAWHRDLRSRLDADDEEDTAPGKGQQREPKAPS